MKKTLSALALLVLSGLAGAEDVTGANRILCSTARAQICFENGECYAVTPWELEIPDFVLIDTKKGVISTTAASGLNRETEFSKTDRSNGAIHLQGIDSGRAFSFVINEATGHMSAAIAADGFSVSVFGACTDAKP